MKTNFAFILGMSLTTLAHAKAFKEIEPCGSATVTEGATCSNAKVDFKFEGCKSSLPATPANSVTCEGEIILAKYQKDDFRYEARFKKSEDGWGAISWKLDGTIKQFQREVSLAKAPIKKEDKKKEKKVEAKKAETKAQVTPIVVEKKEVSATAAPTAIPAPEVSPFKFSAFADVRYTNFHVKHDPLISSGHPESGFGLEDGAFYANYDKGNLSVVLDAAFRRSKDFDTNTSAVRPNESSNNNFAIGVDKSQLYLRYKVNPALTFDLGQFDTIFGVEVNDSKDRVFGKTGLIYDNTLPVTHTGFMMEYSFLGNYYFKAFAANPNNKGTYGSSTSGDDTAEVGGGLGYSSDNYHAQVGFMSRSINKASGLGSAERSLVDVLAGGILGKFSFDLEYTRLSDPSKNTLTSSDVNDNEKAGVGYFSLLSYKFTPDFQVGARFEYVRNDPTAQGIKSSSAVAGSLHYKLTSELELRSEYIAYKNKGVAGNKWDDSRFNFAALVTF